MKIIEAMLSDKLNGYPTAKFYQERKQNSKLNIYVSDNEQGWAA